MTWAFKVVLFRLTMIIMYRLRCCAQFIFQQIQNIVPIVNIKHQKSTNTLTLRHKHINIEDISHLIWRSPHYYTYQIYLSSIKGIIRCAMALWYTVDRPDDRGCQTKSTCIFFFILSQYTRDKCRGSCYFTPLNQLSSQHVQMWNKQS